MGGGSWVYIQYEGRQEAEKGEDMETVGASPSPVFSLQRFFLGC